MHSKLAFQGSISTFKAVIDKALTRDTKSAARVSDIFSTTANTPISVKVESKSFVIVVRKQCFNFLHHHFRQKPRWKEPQLLRLGLVRLLHGTPVQKQSKSLFSGMALVKSALELFLAHVSVNLGAADRVMSEQFLNDSQISPIVEEMRRKCMSKRIWINPKPHSQAQLLNSRLNCRMAQGA